MDQQLYKTTLQAVDELKQARLEQAQVERELNETEYTMQLAHAKVERALIAKMGGDEKRLGLNVDTRERTCLLALNADETYRQKREAVEALKARFAKIKIESTAQYYKLQVLLAVLRTQDIKIEVPLDEGKDLAPAFSGAEL